MISTPVFRRTCQVRVVEEDGVYLLSERDPVLLKGRVFPRLAPLLDGRHTVDAIVEALAGDLSSLEIHFALTFLQRSGYVVEASDAAPPGRLAFWDDLGVDAASAERRLRETTVRVRAVGNVDPSFFAGALAAHGVRTGDAGDPTIVLTDDYLRPELAAINDTALASGSPWLLVKPAGTTIWIGPHFGSGGSACWACLAHRLRLNRSVERYLQRRSGDDTPLGAARASVPATLQAAAGLAALQTIRAVAGDRAGSLHDRIVTLDLLTLRSEQHVVVQRPQCAACGAAAVHEPQPIVLAPRPKTFVADGGHRVQTPEATLERYGRHVSAISGAVRHLERVPIASAPMLHLYDSGENRATTADSLDGLRRSLRNRAAGKGVTDAQARASALCEALERYSGLHQGDEPRVRASCRELGDRAVHPNACMLFSDEQYRRRGEWNARGSRYCRVPEIFDEDAALDWAPLWSFTEGRIKHLPAAYCYYGAGPEAGNRGTVPSSNGAAAGNTIEEAILQGFLELVERDGIALWWYNRVRRPAVDLDSFDEPYFGALRAEYAANGRELWVLDVTTDLGIPVFAALSRRAGGPLEQIVFGFGAHLDPRVGLLRALTEMNQCLTWALADPEPDGAGDHADDMRRWLQRETLITQPHLVPADAPLVTAAAYPRQWSDDLRDDILHCQRIVEAKGLELLVLDQTRADIGLSVARVVVPGLRHFWARFAPGRLYDVPVDLGWLPTPLPEHALNPIAMFW